MGSDAVILLTNAIGGVTPQLAFWVGGAALVLHAALDRLELDRSATLRRRGVASVAVLLAGWAWAFQAGAGEGWYLLVALAVAALPRPLGRLLVAAVACGAIALALLTTTSGKPGGTAR